jgi:hypothetical protein
MAIHIILQPRNRWISEPQQNCPGEGVVIFSVDLINDSWQDYEYFIHAAGAYEKSGEFDLRNRYLRTALTNLFAHLDGVVSEVTNLLVSKELIRSERRNGHRSLKQKIIGLRKYAQRHAKNELPYLDLDLKPLRNIVNHPSVAVGSDGSDLAPVALTQSDVYAIAVEEVTQAADHINRWLNKLCSIAGYERFPDTKAWSKQATDMLVAKLGLPAGTPPVETKAF